MMSRGPDGLEAHIRDSTGKHYEALLTRAEGGWDIAVDSTDDDGDLTHLDADFAETLSEAKVKAEKMLRPYMRR